MSAFVIISVLVSSLLWELLETAIILSSSFIPFLILFAGLFALKQCIA